MRVTLVTGAPPFTGRRNSAGLSRGYQWSRGQMAAARTDYDLIIAGGGLAGASLAIAMASAGHRVLVVEREKQFRDRIRGELLQPWGSWEARRLGIYDALVAS